MELNEILQPADPAWSSREFPAVVWQATQLKAAIIQRIPVKEIVNQLSSSWGLPEEEVKTHLRFVHYSRGFGLTTQKEWLEICSPVEKRELTRKEK